MGIKISGLILFPFLMMTFSTGKVQSQEKLVNIINPHISQKKIQKEASSAEDTLKLPVIDDFAREVGYPYSEIWVDNQAYVNHQYSLNSITIGIATLDAIDETGQVHQPNSNNIMEADKLTSKPIDLNYPAEDSIYLSFYYQPGGLGDTPEPSDSLTVQFYNPDAKRWESAWQCIYYHEDSIIHEIDLHQNDTLIRYTDSTGNKTFRQAMIAITNNAYLKNGFQFRFQNYATTSQPQMRPGRAGNVDHWNIDFVRLDKDRRHNDTIINDVAFIKPLQPMLVNYESLPWQHYPEANAYELKDSLSITYRNIGNKTWNISREFEIIDKMWNNPTETIPGGTGDDVPPYTTEIYPRIISYIFPFNDRDSALFEIKSYLITDTSTARAPYRWNDTISYLQKFYNYYAYDDGTAENGYGFDGVGSENVKVAYKYFNYKPDTLQAIQIYFNQTLDTTNTNYFKLLVWNDQDGQPGDLIYQQDDYRPVYEDSVNKFHNYPLQKKIFLNEGTFYIGYQKFSTEMLNIGFDLNRVNNNKLFYNLSGDWTQSGIEGTLMMRPVFGKYIPYTNSTKKNQLPSEELKVTLYPNPIRDFLKVSIENKNLYNYTYSIYNLQGRLMQTDHTLPARINLSNLSTGIYIIHIQDKTSQTQFREKIVITR